ncbi:MAG: TolC family outer membrane protein [Pseudomonadota bacterium]
MGNRVLLLAVACLALCTARTGLAANDLLATYRAALQNDPVFQAAEYARLASVEVRPQAESAQLPQITLDANIARNDVNDDQRGNFHSDSLGVTVTQSIYRRSTGINLTLADLQIEQARLEYVAAQQSLVLRSAENYFAVLAADDTLQFARSEKSAIERQLEQTNRRYEVGLIAITDVKEAQARFDLAVAQEIAAENQLAAAREAMRVLTGTAPEDLTPLREDAELPAPSPPRAEAWVEIARESNIALQVARLDSELAREAIGLERTAGEPTADLIGNYTNSHNDGFAGDSESGQIRLQLTVPLYTGGLVNSRVRQARANFELTKQQHFSAQRTAEQQTRDAYRNVIAGISRANALKQALLSTQSGAEATQSGFDVGTRTAVEVLAALRETYSAQADYSRARYDVILDSLRLKQAAGTLSLEDLETINPWLEH